MPDFQIRPLTHADCDWVSRVMVTEWGADIVVAHNEIFHPADLPGFAAFAGTEPVGLLTYNITGNECEIVTIDSWREGLGMGTALIEAARQAAGRAGCGRLFLVTTNNNTRALRFYQKHGFVIAAVRLDAMEASRRIKPEIPPVDEDGLPIRDEIELEILL
ncbi:MAG: GNAT family N-acetyltransferase [Candidatus Atribacteria bacterium]|nr:GNAT family N-acetyltransferase [Candidatus Atribacteria bacterium]